MTTASLPEVSVRRAALVLHGLPEADSAWVLRALPAAHRALLEPLLRELQALGIPRERPLLESAASSGVDAGASQAPLQALDDRGIRNLARILQAEPWGVAACLLGAGEQSWREPLLAALDADARERIQALIPRYRHASSLQSAVLQALERAMGSPEERRFEHPAGSRRFWKAAFSAWRRS